MEKVVIEFKPQNSKAPYIVEQGIPISPINTDMVDGLRLIDEKNNPLPASIEHDGRNEHGQTVWVRISTELTSNKILILDYRPDIPKPGDKLKIKESTNSISVKNKYYSLETKNPGNIVVSASERDIINGDVNFQLWPDASSIVGGGAGTCRLAWFEPQNWTIEEKTDYRTLILLKGRVRKFKTVKPPEHEWHDDAQFDCELELICYSFSPVIRYRWRISNHTLYQASLERYTLVLPFAKGAKLIDGEESDDGKFLRYVNVDVYGNKFTCTANFIETLGKGAGINLEARKSMKDMEPEEVERLARGGIFEPYKYLSAKKDEGEGLDIVIGGVNPPIDGNMRAKHPEVHRLFYLGMGKTFEGSIQINAPINFIETELNQEFLILDKNYYSKTCVLPECGDEVYFGKYENIILKAADWLVENQWEGSLWSGEWWREYDLLRQQGVEATANGNGPLGPLYHFFRTADKRMIECAKRALHYEYDVHLSKRREGFGSFYQCRRFLIDKMEWIHMRYQRIEGTIKTAHFFGDRRIRQKTIDAMSNYARNLVCPNGAPGYATGGINGKREPCGADCTNFGETLIILYRETGNPEFLEMAKKMARWTIRFMKKWKWEEYVGNSYGWHFLMRGMLQTIKTTKNKRMKKWYIDMARKNMTYPVKEIEFVIWMDWLIVEAEKMSGEKWMLDVLSERTDNHLKAMRDNGTCSRRVGSPPSAFPTFWDYGYDSKINICYIPVLAARRKALGMKD